MQVLQLLNVVVPEVRCISGTVSKDGSDDAAFTRGAVRYINPISLRQFATSRGAAQRLCRSNGTRFLSGYAIADDRMDAVLAGLEVIASEVGNAKKYLVDNFDNLCEKWSQDNLGILPWQSKFPTAGYVDRQCGMAVAVYKINPQQLPVFSAMEDGVAVELEGLPLQIVQEIAQDVKESWIPDAGRSTQRIKGLLHRVRDKLRSLQFLGGNIQSIATLVEDVISRLPTTGPIEGSDYVLLSGLLFSLADPHRMVRDLSGIDNGSTIDDLWVPPPPPAPMTPSFLDFELLSGVETFPVDALTADPETALAEAQEVVVTPMALTPSPAVPSQQPSEVVNAPVFGFTQIPVQNHSAPVLEVERVAMVADEAVWEF